LGGGTIVRTIGGREEGELGWEKGGRRGERTGREWLEEGWEKVELG